MLFTRKQRLINRLLIVEDEPLVAFDNEHALGEAGYEVVATVDRFGDAMAVIEAGEVDLILSDVALAGEHDGVHLARTVQPLGVRLLFVTGSCPVEAPQISVGCLTKPYAQRDLIDSLKALELALAGKMPKRLPVGLSLY
ncbi:response regulator [Sphingobium boeckii]|uniref:DNA-binding response OmpR family regulator n=1 Tax=Sphingobium boeckii TaxID=1082345 RepID=A0A7W9AK47_9SPHN|nr:response regulator [Sphingobium boeckii]MBB5686937.1 DNA-binding response OmpR family regulator [Sphingobium boeckii]